MDITFFGAVREVTGSMHLITNETDKILLDCGLFQGRRKETAQKNRDLPFDPETITNIVLSHAHIDHSGRLPMLTKNNFNGRIVCTRATADACGYLLPDSAHIQESDANYLNYKIARSFLNASITPPPSKKNKRIKKGKSNKTKKRLKTSGHRLNIEKINELIEKHSLDGVHPLYSKADAEQALKHFDSFPYQHQISIGKNTTCTFYEAGHILGSAISMIKSRANGRSYTICYTGDIGRFNKPIIKDPARCFSEEHRDVDLMVIESTYGNRLHEKVQDLKPQLENVIVDTYNRGGSIIIPSFAFGRTQELLYLLHELYNEEKVPKIPVYVDSPLATKITKVFGEHPELYDEETHKAFLEKNENPFSFGQMNFVESVEESMALNRDERPHIVISASGMCESGRVLHHLRHKIHNPLHTILIVGYMAENTLGRRILDNGEAYEKSGRKGEIPWLKFLNKEYPLKAHVVKLGGFSAHGDKHEMLNFLKTSNLRIKKIAIVHGEEEQSLSFAKNLNDEGFTATAPRPGETIRI